MNWEKILAELRDNDPVDTLVGGFLVLGACLGLALIFVCFCTAVWSVI